MASIQLLLVLLNQLQVTTIVLPSDDLHTMVYGNYHNFCGGP